MISRRVLLLLPIALHLAGCGYTTRGLYPDDVQTVAVPIFKNNTFRRDLEFVLTEKVIQTIEAKTPFKVVAEKDADTVLNGTIGNVIKMANGEDGYGNPRGGNMMFVCNVTWTDKRTGKIINQSSKTFTLTTLADFNINLAQSIDSAYDKAILEMADNIVTLMQSPW